MQKSILKAIRYSSIDEARKILRKVLGDTTFEDPFDDAGEEPAGLLSAIPEGRLPDEMFYSLLEARKGTLIEVEKVDFSGYGPPAEETDYMGFISEQVAYVIRGRCLPISIEGCSFGARDFHHLDSLVLEGQHPINREHLQLELDLPSDWDFDRLFDLIAEGRCTAQEIDQLIHKGLT